MYVSPLFLYFVCSISLISVEHPDIICGDLDSLLPEVEQYYRKEGSQIIKDPDQYSTDLAKCMKSIHDRICQPLKSYSGNIESSSLQSHHDLDVVIVGGLGGRADQAFSLLHHLYTESEDSSLLHGKLYLVTPESIIFLLHKGPNKIISPVGPDLLGENIGIIPIARPSVITTHGLEWDVSDWCTEFGGQVSTSNHIRSSTVEVETTERVLFTVEIARN